MSEHLPTIEQTQALRLTATVKPEAVAFLQAHGCVVQHQEHGGEMVIFPAGSRQEGISQTSKRCSNITLPDGTVITAMDCCTRYILLVIDPLRWYTTHLTV